MARSLPLGPDSTGTIDGLRLSDSSFEDNEYRGLYFEGLGAATIDGIRVSGTGQGMPSLPSGGRGLELNLKAGDYGDVEISNSTIAGSVNAGLLAQARGYPGDSSYEATPATLRSLRVDGATLIGNGGPGMVVDNEESLGAVAITGSRIVGNGNQAPSSVTPVNGIFAWNEADAAPGVAAAGNWFGCNAGPLGGGAACDTVNAPVGAAPWLVLRAAVSPQTIAPGGQAAVTAAIDTDSAGNAAAPAPDGIPVSFASDLGVLTPASTVLAGGVGSALLSAGEQEGSGAVTASADGETVAVPVEVRRPAAAVPPATPPASAPEPEPASVGPPVGFEPTGGDGPTLVPANGAVTVAVVACATESCAVKVQGRPQVRIAGSSYRIRVRMRRRLGAGDSAKVRIVLPRRARRALAREGRGRLRLNLRMRGSDGTVRTFRVKVVLKDRRSRHQGRGGRGAGR